MIVALIALSLAPVLAQDQAAGTPPQRIRNVQLLPGEKCPTAQGDEIVVCGTVKDQFRIPPQLREPANPAANQAWSNRAAAVMDDNRRVLPGSCSAIGTGGQTGCSQQALERWAAERRGTQNATPPR